MGKRVEMVWDSVLSLKEIISEDIHSIFREHAGFLYDDLDYKKQSVVLVVAPDPRFDGHYIRAVEQKTPTWYSELHAQYDRLREPSSDGKSRRNPSKQRPGKTIGVIKRNRSLEALERIFEGNDREYTEYQSGKSMYRYDMIYRDLIYEHLTEGFNSDGIIFKPNEEVVRHFSKNGKR